MRSFLRVNLALLMLMVLFDVVLFFALPQPNIYQIPYDSMCRSSDLGCAFHNGPYGYTTVPSFAVAVHEYSHTIGYDEPRAMLVTITQFLSYGLLALAFIHANDSRAIMIYWRRIDEFSV